MVKLHTEIGGSYLETEVGITEESRKVPFSRPHPIPMKSEYLGWSPVRVRAPQGS